MDCTSCPKRPACRKLCPEIARLLPAMSAGNRVGRAHLYSLSDYARAFGHGRDTDASADLRHVRIESIRSVLDRGTLPIIATIPTYQVRSVLERWYWEGLSQKAIAQIEHITREQVGWIIRKAARLGS